MKRFRIGNGIHIFWNVLRNGEPVDLSDKVVTLYLTHARGRENIDYENIDGNQIEIYYDGLDQKVLGKYTITADIKHPLGTRFMIQDKCCAFELVGRSCAEEPEETDYTLYL